MFFADTSYLVALLHQYDPAHLTAMRFARQSPEPVTTQWVFSEVLAYFARSPRRSAATQFVLNLQEDPTTVVVPADDAAFRQGLGLYRDRLDKDWSLVDCISFELMRERDLTGALTTDHHFEQAGFHALLRG